MNTTSSATSDSTAVPPLLSNGFAALVDAAVASACAKIAPTWPLDRFIAVNPFWQLVDRPLSEVAATLQALSGAQLLMPRSWYRQAYQNGQLLDSHLQAALVSNNSKLTLNELCALLKQEQPTPPVRARVIDVVDEKRDLVHEVSWRSFVTHSISQFCAAYFDKGQAQFGPPVAAGFYQSWRKSAVHDRSPLLLMNAPNCREYARELPTTADQLIKAALEALQVPPQLIEGYLWSLLLDQNGWASWCAYRAFTARFDGQDDNTIVELLAVRLAWEWMVYRSAGSSIASRWTNAMASWPQLDATAAQARPHDWLLQTAMETAWREPILRELASGLQTIRADTPLVQAVFCIDVRSEVFRRALEAASPQAHTLGFAGFFGIAMEYQALGTAISRPQLPGLLAPQLRALDTGLTASAAALRTQHLQHAATWRAFKTDPLSTFTFVEALGLTYIGKFLKDSFGWGNSASTQRLGLSPELDADRKPRLATTVAGTPIELKARCDLAEAMLRGMSLTHSFARLVLLAGHGSSTRNNPHASGLDCGACCGQSGEVNARVAAALLNEPEVRQGLALRGVQVPDSTVFVPGLHNTTTDDVSLFDLDELPASHHHDLESLRTWLAEAGSQTRRERSSGLELAHLAPKELHRAVRACSTDWSQVRAEWGLANNAAFIVAPREHCRHVNLQGRSFLQEYRYQEDSDFAVLEQIMTAPMVVAHWINFQYYASTVDNLRYGSGNKVLHNVVGEHLGVFEGNGGDLRIGLPMQSLHDGNKWVHTPLRLSVFIEAPRDAIDKVLGKHAHVNNLIANNYVSLFQLSEQTGEIFALREGAWQREASSSLADVTSSS